MYYVARFQELSMKTAIVAFLLVGLAMAQDAAPAKRVEWNPAAPGAIKELPDGRTQKTVRSETVAVSAISDVVSARRFVEPPADGGKDVTYIVVGIQNTSKQPIRLDPSLMTLRVVGKKEKELKQLREDQVIGRAWQGNDRVGGAMPAMAGSMAGGAGGDASLQAATTHQQLDTSNRRLQQASEQQTGVQTAKLKERALPQRDLAPGEQVMGLVFFYPYEAKEKVELSVPIGDTMLVIPFAGRKAKQ
jgi:hypothetical protein